MNIYISGIIVFSLALSAVAKPGEPYTLTGREKSIFSIYQADMKAYPELYEGEDINAYYKAFKALNNLDGRKLKLGEELIFPHTEKSAAIEEEEIEKAAAEKARAEAAAARARAKEVAANTPQAEENDDLSLFGSDRRSSPANEIARAEAAKKRARQNAVYTFQHALLPDWICDPALDILENIEKGNVEPLTEKALEKVDAQFAGALTLHRYPDKGIYILGFENPDKVHNCFFVAIKKKESAPPTLYFLEKGISFFGTGDVSVLIKHVPGWTSPNLGGRSYADLTSFLQEIEAGPTEKPNTE